MHEWRTVMADKGSAGLLARVLPAGIIAIAACGGPSGAAHGDVTFLIDTIATAETAHLVLPVRAYPMADSQVAVVDWKGNRIVILNAAGETVASLGRPGAGPGELSMPRGIAFRGDTLAVYDVGNGRLSNFILGKGFVGSRPLRNGFGHQDFLLLPGDTVLHTTDGTDSALAVLRDPGGRVIARYGTPEAPGVTFMHFGNIKKTIASGRVPDELKNDALPATGPDRDVWVVHQVNGVIEHFDPSGGLRGRLSLPEAYVQEREAEFFRRNREIAGDREAGFFPYLVVGSAVAERGRLWLMLLQPDTVPARILEVDTSYSIRGDYRLQGVMGTPILMRDSLNAGFLLLDLGEGIVMRARTATRQLRD